MKLYITLLVTACAAGACHKDFSDATPATTYTTSATVDDHDKSGVDETDSERTAEVRNALLTSSTLGPDAKSIDVTTQNGVITLRGQVASDESKSLAESTAMSAAGGDQVDNQLEVFTSTSTYRGVTRYGNVTHQPPAYEPNGTTPASDHRDENSSAK
jgi:osmotically-inducible protein OsmY